LTGKQNLAAKSHWQLVTRKKSRNYIDALVKESAHFAYGCSDTAWGETRQALFATSVFILRADMTILTPEANRAARAILKWSVRELADKAGIAFSTVHRFESTGNATEATKEKIKAAYAAHGVEITNGDYTGARLRLQRPDGS